MKTTSEIKQLLLEHFRTMLALSKQLNVTPQRIYHWVNKDTNIPNEYMLKINKLTKGKIKISDMMKKKVKNAL